MKNITWLLILFLFCYGLTASAQKSSAKLFLKDSTIVVGLAKITKSDKIVFRKDAKAKKVTYTDKEVYEIHIKAKGFYKRYFSS